MCSIVRDDDKFHNIPFAQNCFGYWGLLCSHIKFKIVFRLFVSISLRNFDCILSGVALN